MPAPDLPTLYDFETHFESALANYFANALANVQVLTPRTLSNVAEDTDFLRTPRVTCSFAVTGTGIQKGFNANGSEYYADRMGLVTLQAVTDRNDTAQDYGRIRGAARVGMLEVTQVFNANSLPFYQVVDVTEGSSGQEIDKVNDEILTQLTFPLTFFIQPDAFPGS